MNRNPSLLLLPLVGAVGLTGCITETGNPEMGSFGVTARTTAPEQVALGEAGEGIVLDEAWVVLGDIRFVREEVCDTPGETEVDVPGPWVVDLVADPEAVTVRLAADDYCRVRVPLDRADGVPAGAPPELADNAFVIRGTRADGVPFTLVSRDKTEADVRSRGEPFSVDEAGAALLLAFDVAAWFDGVPLDGAQIGPDGEIFVGDDRNEAVLEAFEERVEASLELFDDEDGDLEVDDDDAPLAEGGAR